MTYKPENKCDICGQALVWEGSIMSGGMVCKNPHVKKTFDLTTYDLVFDDIPLLSNPDDTVNNIKSYADVPHIPTIMPIASDPILVRYYRELPLGHRKWCHHVMSNGITFCDCGYGLSPTPLLASEVIKLELAYYGPIVAQAPTAPAAPVSALFARYHAQVIHIHRSWCNRWVGLDCDCGHSKPCAKSKNEIEILEQQYHGNP